MIHDIEVFSLHKVANERGFLMEVQRRDSPDFMGFGQIYITQTLPGVVKAWYRHKIQTDQIAIVAGKLRLALFDSRPSSTTFGQIQEIMLDAKTPVLVRIPPGIWHGFTPANDEPALLAHLNSEPFFAAAPDEERLPFNDSTIPYIWYAE